MHSTSSTEMMLAEGFLDHAAYDVESGIQPLITPSGIGAEIRWACDPFYNDMTIWRTLYSYLQSLHTELLSSSSQSDVLRHVLFAKHSTRPPYEWEFGVMLTNRKD